MTYGGSLLHHRLRFPILPYGLVHIGLQDLELDIDHLTSVKDDQELQLEKGGEALRTIKAQNEQVMMGLTTSRAASWPPAGLCGV